MKTKARKVREVIRLLHKYAAHQNCLPALDEGCTCGLLEALRKFPLLSAKRRKKR